MLTASKLRRAAKAGLIVALLGCGSPVLAQTPAPTPAALATAKQIVVITGVTRLFDPLIPGVIEQAKILFLQQNPALAKDLNDVSANLRTELAPRFDEIVSEVARQYAIHFTEQELKDILKLYQSPLGKKMLTEQPKVADASVKFAQDWANKLSDQVVKRIREEMKKRGHDL